jgi:starch synthase (maltosyl-transferring)
VRIVISNVTPVIDGGRYAVKRLVGDLIRVEADILKEGHDLLAARVCVRRDGDRGKRHAPMTYDAAADRWHGTFPVDQAGRWWFTIEAWYDVFGTWRADLLRRVQAGMDVASELHEGSILLDRLTGRWKGEPRQMVRRLARIIGDESKEPWERVEAAESVELRSALEGCVERESLTRSALEHPAWVDRASAGFAAWYEMFPRSQGKVPVRHGTFADASARLPELADLGFDVVYLPPIHPIGRTNRKGPNNTLETGPEDPGSPWAIGSRHGGHTAIEPALGTLSDFARFVERARAVGLEVALDYALQCSPDHPWVTKHPDWFFIRPDGHIRCAENPPKKYEDIYPLNFWCTDHRALWTACRDIILFWMERGVRIFRVDNPHTKPLALWEWMIADIQARDPGVIFLSEAFTRPKLMKALAKVGFTQSYTYFTWRNSGWELREYLTELTTTEMVEYFRPNFFANTPDILHEFLQSGGRPAFRLRLLLAATLSPLYGIYSGYELCENVPRRAGSEEYLNSEKYEIKVRDWDAEGNIKADIARINRIRRENPALQRLANLTFAESDHEQILCYAKSAPGNDLLIVVNLDPHAMHETMVTAPIEDWGLEPDQTYEMEDLLTGERYTWRGARNYVRLDPREKLAHVLRLIPPVEEC